MEALPHHGRVFRSCRVQLHVQILPEHVDSIEGADDRERKLGRVGKHSNSEDLRTETLPPLPCSPKALREARLSSPRLSKRHPGSTPGERCSPSVPNPCLFRCRSPVPHLLTGGAAAAAPAEQGDPAGGCEAQQMNPWPRIPHLEARTPESRPPGDSQCRSGSTSRSAVWSRQRARSEMTKFPPSSTQTHQPD